MQDYIVGDPSQLWKSLVMTAGVLLPIATLCMIRAIRPYREEVERLAAEAANS